MGLQINNGKCPLCGQQTAGKQVRGVNFCLEHREAAIKFRDSQKLDKNEIAITGLGFAQMLTMHVLETNPNTPGLSRARTDIRAKISEIANMVTPGQHLEIEFNDDAPIELPYLVGILQDGFLEASREDKTLIEYLAMTKNWSNHPIRTFVFRVNRWGDTERQWFIGRMARAIEDISIKTDVPDDIVLA